MKTILTVLLTNIFMFVFPQHQPQKIEGNCKAYEINIKDASPDGKWLAVYKIYDNKSDTLMIINRENPKRIYQKIKVLDYKWTLNKLIFRFENRTEIFDYNNNKSEVLHACESFGINQKENSLLLHGSEKITVYNLKNSKLTDSISAVKKVFYTGDHILALVKKENTYKLTDLTGNAPSTLYETSKLITNVVELKNRSFLIFETEENRVKDIVYCIPQLKTVFHFSDDHYVDYSFAIGYQRSDGGIVLTTEKLRGNTAADSPEIWHSSESNFREKFNKSASSQFLWLPEQKDVIKLGVQKMDRVVDVDNKKYFLSYRFSEMQDYTNSDASLKLYRYDFKNDLYDYIDIVTAGASYSPDGNYIIYKQNNYWKLVEINSLKAVKIEDHNFFQPYFSDQKYIYFDGSEGLWAYSINTDQLSLNYNEEKGNYKILNSKYSTNFMSNLFELAFSCKTVTAKHFIFEINDKSDLSTSIYEKSGNRYYQMLASTDSKLVFKSLTSKNGYLFMEQNYNQPNQLISLSRSKDKKIIYQSNKSDKAQFNIRMETISFKNKEGLSLKGILYYPLDYDPEKRYPMIVHVYQLQSPKRNIYPLFLEHKVNAGFNIRDFIDRGYFVFLPDIVNSDKGIGLAALDCVHNSLDALRENPSIDFQKVALIGHSFGGYVTNFIATHSDRFATYVSGASVSDIVKSYFSMSFHIIAPLYWQYESGQFSFGKSYSAAKDLYALNNPISFVENVTQPIMLWTGKKDLNVEWGQTMEFYLGLKRAKKPVTMLVYPQEGHFLAAKDNAKDLLKKVNEWFGYYLKGTEKPDWIE
ncbi:prolyl oligopeptidase family serine peptidase [Chryseobacterium sp. 2987]|uniref:alpha/beta hydrolase family protein n=1 Tax=Chryseobacterium sp. 2987 TaxID=2817767 RepID=UPI002864FBDC|nr:prolyl oligopeptidase family serine peptidase [Chryseobacterium sp. 2987]MDR6919991.1 dipeptidyl aminopeptidase/acylaminoacyl peptidase [Chryseobacterium sp. 2987]